MVRSGISVSRLRATLPSRMNTCSPLRSFSCASASTDDSWQLRIPTEATALSSFPPTNGQWPSMKSNRLSFLRTSGSLKRMPGTFMNSASAASGCRLCHSSRSFAVTVAPAVSRSDEGTQEERRTSSVIESFAAQSKKYSNAAVPTTFASSCGSHTAVVTPCARAHFSYSTGVIMDDST